MFEALHRTIEQLREFVAVVEPDRLDGAGARALVELFADVERLGAAGKALASRQVVETGAWKHDGAHRDAAGWLASTTGATVGAVRATIETAARLGDLPCTEAALRAGALSVAQVEAIADAATADPTAERSLLERAHYDGVRGLRNECARVKAAACVDEHERYDRIREARSFRPWTDADGVGRIDVRGPVDAIARILAPLAPFERELFEAARADGRCERSDALAFDALVALAEASAGTRSERASGTVTTVVRVDHAALQRGTDTAGRSVRDRRQRADSGHRGATNARGFVREGRARRRHRRARGLPSRPYDPRPAADGGRGAASRV